MIISLLCFTGFEILNAFSYTCSIDNIRKRGSHWTTLRNAFDELDNKKLLRVSFDNLNYKIKFVKKLAESESGHPQRMLNLITGQAVFRYDNLSHKKAY